MLPHGKQALILRTNIPRIARLPSPKFPKHSNREQAHMDRTNFKSWHDVSRNEMLDYRVKGLHSHKSTRTSTETHLAALAVGSQACRSQSQKLKNMMDTPLIASASINSTLCLASPPPKRLYSTISHPFVHLHHAKSIQN